MEEENDPLEICKPENNCSYKTGNVFESSDTFTANKSQLIIDENPVNDLMHICRFCSKHFDLLEKLKIHEESHPTDAVNDNKIEITKDKCTEQAKSYDRYLGVVDNDPRIFECALCDEAFSDENNRKDHVQTHVNEKPFECPDCEVIYEDLEMFYKHIKEHDLMYLSRSGPVEENVNEIDDMLEDIAPASCHSNDSGNESSELDNILPNESTDDPIENIEHESSYVTPPKEEEDEEEMKQDKRKTKNTGIDFQNETKVAKKQRASTSVEWQKNDNKIRNFFCNVCDRSFTMASTLSLHHRRVHLGIKPYECKDCGWKFAQTSDLIKHRRKHTGERPYKCDFCQMAFAQKRNLSTHMKMHTNAPSVCKYCEKKFLLETSLKQHLKKHEADSVEKCPHCSIPYASLEDLRIHIKKKHPKEPTISLCHICDKQFKKSCDLQKHLRTHTDERPYKCDFCDKTFNHATSLRNHRAGIHSNERPFQCSFCGKHFTFLGNLKVHMRSHTNERPFACHICPKSFVRNSNLLEHIKIHTGIKSHKCEICEKSFTNSSTYFKHKKIHTGERKHKCPVCEKAFIQMSHLTKHIRIHTNEKPFRCNVCTKSFRRSDTLFHHKKTHSRHKELPSNGKQFKNTETIDTNNSFNNLNIQTDATQLIYQLQENQTLEAISIKSNDLITITATLPSVCNSMASNHNLLETSEMPQIIYTFTAPDVSELTNICQSNDNLQNGALQMTSNSLQINADEIFLTQYQN